MVGSWLSGLVLPLKAAETPRVATASRTAPRRRDGERVGGVVERDESTSDGGGHGDLQESAATRTVALLPKAEVCPRVATEAPPVPSLAVSLVPI